MQDDEFGQLAARSGFVDEAALAAARDKLARAREIGLSMSLAELLVRDGTLDNAQADVIGRLLEEVPPENLDRADVRTELGVSGTRTYEARLRDDQDSGEFRTLFRVQADSDGKTVLYSPATRGDAPADGAPADGAPAGELRNNETLGRYRILRKLGQGGMGAVYLAEDTGLARQVAIKVLPQEMTTRRSYLDRFYREARAAARLQHPNLVTVHDVGSAGNRHFIVMEFVDGESLQARLDRVGALSLNESLRVLRHALEGIHYAHSHGVVHRDLKPDNVLLSQDGRVKVADFGLARITTADSRGLTMTGEVMGTPHYMSPEQIQDTSTADHRTDLYALGVMMFQMITGRRPYTGETALSVMMKHLSDPVRDPREIDPSLPEPLAGCATRLMAKAPADRYADAAEALDALRRAVHAINREKSDEKNSPGKGREPESQPPAVPVAMAIPVASPAGGNPPALPASAPAAIAKAPRARAAGGRVSAPPWFPAPLARVVDRLGWSRRRWGLAAAAAGVFLLIVAGAAGSGRGRGPDNASPASGKAGKTAPPQARPPAEIVNSVGMRLMLIKPGVFTMGDKAVSDNPPHRVTITRAFYMGATEVTNAQFRKFYDEHNSGAMFGVDLDGEDFPAVQLTWHQARAFCRWLSRKEARAYRLPTEAEWEYACLAGRETRYPWGDRASPSGKAGNYSDKALRRKRIPGGVFAIRGYDDGYAGAAPVGSFPSNPWGLHDMGGNVREWCLDAYDSAACKEPATDPRGPRRGNVNVVRDAGWNTFRRAGLLIAARGSWPAEKRLSNIGFRVVLEAPER